MKAKQASKTGKSFLLFENEKTIIIGIYFHIFYIRYLGEKRHEEDEKTQQRSEIHILMHCCGFI